MQQFIWRSVAVLGLIVAVVSTVSGNGEEFFVPAKTNRPVNLIYVGQIRERSTGHLVRDQALIVITDKRSGLTFPFANDAPGHYRSPDVGASIKVFGGKPDALEFELTVPGYKTATLTKLPRKTSGIVEVNVKLEREWSDSSRSPYEESSGGPMSRGIWFVLIGGVAMVIAGITARTLALRRSTVR